MAKFLSSLPNPKHDKNHQKTNTHILLEVLILQGPLVKTFCGRLKIKLLTH